jgi:hypothetical protein
MKQNKNNLEKNYLWADRVRHWGLPVSFTKYSLDEDRLYIDRGLFTTNTDEILLYRILDIKTKRTLWQKIFGVGTVILYSADKSDNVLELKNIKKPKEVHKYISELVEQRRTARGVAGREMVGSSAVQGQYNYLLDNDGNGVPDALEE